MSERLEHLPYELLAEQLAKEKMDHIRELYGDDPHVLVSYLPVILKDCFHDCIEIGMQLNGKFPTIGIVDLAEAFNEGVRLGIIEGDNHDDSN